MWSLLIPVAFVAGMVWLTLLDERVPFEDETLPAYQQRIPIGFWGGYGRRWHIWAIWGTFAAIPALIVLINP